MLQSYCFFRVRMILRFFFLNAICRKHKKVIDPEINLGQNRDMSSTKSDTTEATTYMMRYQPKRHLGQSNWRGEEYTYVIETAANVEAETFYANDLDANGQLKRFNSWNTIEIITITE